MTSRGSSAGGDVVAHALNQTAQRAAVREAALAATGVVRTDALTGVIVDEPHASSAVELDACVTVVLRVIEEVPPVRPDGLD